MTTLAGVRKSLGFHITQPVVGLLARTPVTPNSLTWAGLAGAVASGALIATGHPFAAGFVVLASGFFDTLDGALARSTGRATPFGAVLDSTLDRLGEAAILLGLMVFYARGGEVVGVAVAGAVWLASSLVSYIRARAEAAGLECQVGLFTRVERILVLALGLLLSQVSNALLIALSIVALLSLVTVVQRLRHVWRQAKAG